MESVQLKINEHMTSVGEDILCVLGKQQYGVKIDVRVFVLERLHAAAQFMFNLFKREMETLETLLDKHNKLLDIDFDMDIKLHTADQCVESSRHVKTSSPATAVFLKQEPEDNVDRNLFHVPVCKEEVTSEEEWSSSPDQGEPQLHHIKEEQEGLLQRPEAASGSMLTLLAVKSEDDDENREPEPAASTSTEHMNTQADVEDCGTSQPTRDDQLLSPHCSESDVTEDSDEWEETTRDQSAYTLKSKNVGGQCQLSQDLKSSKQTASGSMLTLLAVKTEDDDENREPEPAASTTTEHTNTQADVEDCGTSQPTMGDQLLSPHCSESDVTEDSDEWEETTRDQSAYTLKSKNVGGQCKLSQDLKSSKQTHPMRSHTGKKSFSSTAECGKIFNHKGNLKKRMMPHTGEKPFVCTVCGKGCTQKHELKIHMMTHTGEKPFSCTVCGRGWVRANNLKIHMMTHTGEKPFLCVVCGKGSVSASHLKVHMRTHTAEKPFLCTVCGKGCTQKGELKIHMMTHTGEKPFSCAVCGKGYVTANNLKLHMMTHTGKKPFSCTVCGKGCVTANNLKLHMTTHTGKKPFSCTVCGKGCVSTTNLKIHMMTHTGEKPFLCTVCGHGWASTSHLKVHMRTHTGEKPFSCAVCGRGCVSKGNLKVHMRTHTGEKPLSCTVCGQGCASTNNLKRHMMIHTGEKPFLCTVCRKDCVSAKNLKKHMMTHTGGKSSV